MKNEIYLNYYIENIYGVKTMSWFMTYETGSPSFLFSQYIQLGSNTPGLGVA